MNATPHYLTSSGDYRKTLCPAPLNDRDPFNFVRVDKQKGISVLGI